MDHGFVDGVSSLVWENASGETGNNLLNLELLGERKNVVVDCHVDSEELQVGLHVAVKTTDLGGQVDHVRGLVFLEDLKGTGSLLSTSKCAANFSGKIAFDRRSN